MCHVWHYLVKKAIYINPAGSFRIVYRLCNVSYRGFVERLRVFKTELIGSEVYLEVGFEDLSHFSAFAKEQYFYIHSNRTSFPKIKPILCRLNRRI